MDIQPTTETCPPTREAALARIAAVNPAEYARSRNAIDGAVSWLSPYITHGLVDLHEVLAGVAGRHALDVRNKFVQELGWREYFRHVWHHRGDAILRSLHEGVLPEHCYANELPADVRSATTGVPVIDTAVRTLYATGLLHNHARLWLASYVVHVRKVHWRAGADWLYGHLLDGDLASNHLSWQWVAGTGSSKPYLFNADNVARFAPATWHSSGSVLDTTYEALDRLARQPSHQPRVGHGVRPVPATHAEPRLLGTPPEGLGWAAPDAASVAGCDVWLVHPWNLGEPTATLPDDARVIAMAVNDFHQAWPWSERRWRFVSARMGQLAHQRWCADATTLAAALQGARRVRSLDEPHLRPWLPRLADCAAAPTLFPTVDRPCDSFSQWWNRTSRGLDSIEGLLANRRGPTEPSMRANRD